MRLLAAMIGWCRLCRLSTSMKAPRKCRGMFLSNVEVYWDYVRLKASNNEVMPTLVGSGCPESTALPVSISLHLVVDGWSAWAHNASPVHRDQTLATPILARARCTTTELNDRSGNVWTVQNLWNPATGPTKSGSGAWRKTSIFHASQFWRRSRFQASCVGLPRVTPIVGSWNSLLHHVRMLMFSRSLRILRHTCTLQHPPWCPCTQHCLLDRHHCATIASVLIDIFFWSRH